MTWLTRRLLSAGLVFAVPLRQIWSAPVAYEMLLAAEPAAPSEQVAGLLERNLPQVSITVLSPADRYRQYPHFPVTACMGTEYFVLAHGQRLIAFGCLAKSSAAAEVLKIRRALSRDEEIMRADSKEILYDAALHSAAAGNWPAARRYAAAYRVKIGATAGFEVRLQRLLDRQGLR